MSRGDWAILFTLSLFWGSSYMLNKLALPGFPVLTLVFIRVTIAGGVLWLILRATGERLPRGWRIWAAMLLLAALNTVLPLCLFSEAQRTISVALASILNGMTPIWAVLVAHFLTSDEKATAGRVLGVLLGFGGMATVIGAEALYGLGGHLTAQFMCLAATFFNALAGVYGRHFTQSGVKPLTLATAQLLMAALILAPAALLIDQPWTMPPPGTTPILAMLALTFFSTALAFVLFFRLLASAGVTNSLLVTFLLPVVAIFEGLMILGEPVERQHLIGLALIVAGLVCVDGRVWRALRSASAGGKGRPVPADPPA